MNVVVLAAGYGTRLGKLCKDKPKPLLNICDKPIMEYALDELSRTSCGDETCFFIINY